MTAIGRDYQRFQSGAGKYADYLKTLDGRLRLDIAFRNLEEFLPEDPGSLRALDIGCGTGTIAVRLARLGVHVTLLDSSVEMLDYALRNAHEAGVAKKITSTHGDASQLADLFQAGSFDVIVCHNILEYLDHPCAVVRSAARVLGEPSGIISVLVRNQAGEVLKAAIKDGDLAASEDSLSAEWGHESLFGGRVRLFAPDSLRAMLAAASLSVAAERGVRVLSDYLPPSVSRDDQYERILELERRLGKRPDFAPIARYTHSIARRAGAITKEAR